MTNYQCQDGRGKEKEEEGSETWGVSKKWVPDCAERSTGSCTGPQEMTGPFGMHVRCLVFWSACSDAHGQSELATSKPLNTLCHHSGELQAAARSCAGVALATHTGICPDIPVNPAKGWDVTVPF